jgi:hypothetical protein
MADINEIFSGERLTAADLGGREHTVKIKQVEPIEFQTPDGKPDKKLLLKFVGAKKEFVCNKTNAKRIALLHGSNYDNWLAKQIVLGPELVDFRGEPTWAIRVKQAAESEPAPKIKPAPKGMSGGGTFSDDIPF